MSQLVLDLQDRSTVKVRKAAKLLRKYPQEGMCSLLVEAYKREIQHNKSWETQNELIATAGILGCRDFIPFLEKICQKNELHDMITINAGLSYVRLSRKDMSDVSPIFKYMNGVNYSLGHGFLYALGFDNMVPNIKDQAKLISKFHNFGYDRDSSGYSDPRYGLAAASAGWDFDTVKDFLSQCMIDGDEFSKFVAESSLKRKYVKQHRLSPY